MKNFDAGEVIPLALDFMATSHEAGEPFFVWLNTSRMHLYTRLNDEWRYAAEEYTSEADIHGSGMLQHDHDVGIVRGRIPTGGARVKTITTITSFLQETFYQITTATQRQPGLSANQFLFTDPSPVICGPGTEAA